MLALVRRRAGEPSARPTAPVAERVAPPPAATAARRPPPPAAAAQEYDVIVVYNHAFCPREYLREKLALQLINFMRNWFDPVCLLLRCRRCRCLCRCSRSRTLAGSVAPDDKAGTIQRPTVLERRITVYASVIQEAENYVALDTAGQPMPA